MLLETHALTTSSSILSKTHLEMEANNGGGGGGGSGGDPDDVKDKRKTNNISEYDSSESSSSSSQFSDVVDNINNGGGNNESQHQRDKSSLGVQSSSFGAQSSVPANDATEIREVWSHNLYDAFIQISGLVAKFPFVAMDTEFPGIVAKPIGNFSTMDEYKYQLVKCNVDLLKMIQLGVTLFDGDGARPDGVCTWQFNFKFCLQEDLYAEDSIDLLMHSGIQFEKHNTEGIDPCLFAELLLTSGLVLMDNVTWLTFHSAYDFGYLLSQLTSCQLPESETEFLETLRVYFPNLYDIKYLMGSTETLNGGLQKVANELQVKRIGIQHQAGSDSLLTGQVFFKMYNEYFSDGLDDVKYNGMICGLGGTNSSSPCKAAQGVTIDEMLEELHVSTLINSSLKGQHSFAATSSTS